MAVDSFDPIPGRKQRDRDSYRVSFWYMNQQLWGTGDSSFGQRGVCSHGQSLSHTSRSPRHEMPFSAVLTWALGSKDLLLWISGMQDKEGHSWDVQLPTTTGQGPSWALVLRGWICCILTAPSKQIQMKCPSNSPAWVGGNRGICPSALNWLCIMVTNDGDWRDLQEVQCQWDLSECGGKEITTDKIHERLVEMQKTVKEWQIIFLRYFRCH